MYTEWTKDLKLMYGGFTNLWPPFGQPKVQGVSVSFAYIFRSITVLRS